jgi:hypothetical protein
MGNSKLVIVLRTLPEKGKLDRTLSMESFRVAENSGINSDKRV